MNDSSASASFAFFAAARTCFARLTSAVDGAVGGALRLGAAVRAVAAAGEDAASSETRWWVAGLLPPAPELSVRRSLPLLLRHHQRLP